MNKDTLMNHLERLLEGQADGSIKAADAVEQNNSIGKAISLIKVDLEYSALKAKLGKKAPVIEWLEK